MSVSFNGHRIHQNFARQSMMSTFEAKLTRVALGECQISAPILDFALQQQGAAHAALTFALGDSAAGYAALTMMPENKDVVTAEMKINLLAPALGRRLVATGRVIKPGRRLIVVSSEIHMVCGDEHTLVAVMQGTMVPVPLPA